MPFVVVEIPAVVAALFALLFMLSWWVFGNTITNIINNINLPIVGNFIGAVTSALLDAVYSTLVNWLDALLQPMVNVILGPIAAIENGFDSIHGTFESVIQSLIDLRTIIINTAIGTSVQVTIDQGFAILDQAEAYTDHAINQAGISSEIIALDFSQLQGQLQTEIANTYNELQATVAASVVNVPQIVAQVEADIAAGLVNTAGTADAYVDAQITNLTNALGTYLATIQGDIASGVADAEHYADTLIGSGAGAIITDINSAITATLGGIYTDIDQAIDDVVGVIGTTDAGVLAGVRAIPTSIPIDIPDVAALAGASTLTLLRFLKDCGIPNCQNLSGLGNDLQALLGFVDDAAFLTFLIEIIHNPGDASGAVTTLFGAGLDATVSTFREHVGV